jgi:hypothetical protein
MRFSLRTLLILATIGPPILAVAWFGRRHLGAAIGWALIFGFFTLWYAMLCKSQTNPTLRGKPNYDPPSVVPPPDF